MRTFILFLFLLMTLDSHAQVGQYGLYNTGNVLKAIPDKNKSSEIAVNNGYITISKLDSSRNYVWQSLIQDTLSLTAFDFIRTLDSGYAFCGSAFDYPLMLWYPMIIKLDKSGNIEWGKKLFYNFNGQFNSLIQKPDSSFIVTGNIAGVYNYNDNNVILTSFDKHGNYNWSRVYGSIQAEDEGRKIVNMQDSSYVVMAGSGFAFGEGMILMKFNDQDSLLWSKGYEVDYTPFQSFNDDITLYYFSDIINTFENGLAISATTMQQTFTLDLAAIKLDEDGNFEWCRSVDNGSNEWSEGITQLKDSGFIMVAAHNFNFHPYGHSIILKMNRSGNVLWDNNTGDSLTNSYSCVYEDESGNINASGYSNDSIRNSIYWSIFNPDGYGCGTITPTGTNKTLSIHDFNLIVQDTDVIFSTSNCGVIYPISNPVIDQLCSYTPLNIKEADKQLFYTYPSPAKSYFIIDSYENTETEISISLFDQLGIKVYEKDNYLTGSKINTPGKPGVYFINVNCKAKFFRLKIIVI